MSINDLPIEILEQIAKEIETPSDLCSFGVCRRLRSIIFPYHIQLRIIRCPLLSSVWEKLSVQHSLAANVRVVEIQSTSQIKWMCHSVERPVVPPIFDEPSMPQAVKVNRKKAKVLPRPEDKPSDLQAERVLVSALRNMTGLVSFRWSRTPPLIDPDLEDDVWTTLIKYSPNLREVNVLDDEGSDPHQPHPVGEDVYHRPTRNPAFLSFNDLTFFSLSTDAYNAMPLVTPDMEPFVEMLVERSPNLQVLRIDLVLYTSDPVVPMYPLLGNSHWKSLVELCLSPASAPSDVVSAFLSSHPTIEHLSLWNMKEYRRSSICSPDRLVLPPSALPRLRILDASRDDMFSILNSTAPDVTPRPLQRISGVSINADFLKCLEKSGSGSTLKRLDATSCADADLIVKLASIAPGLEWLDTGNMDIRKHERWCHAITHLRSLVALDGLGLLFSDRSCAENSFVIRTLVTGCPRLRRMVWCTPASSEQYVVVIERKQGRVKWNVRFRMGDEEGGAPDYWNRKWKGRFEI